MNINDKLCGFTVTEKRYVEEISADAYTLIFDKTGTRLTFLDRDDDNKTFAYAIVCSSENCQFASWLLH